MKLYTADMHVDHKNIIHLCKRPFTGLQEMQDALITNWNNVVSDNDDVYHLGDFTFGVSAAIDIISELNGKIHFIYGNHDNDAMWKLSRMKGNNSILDNCFFHGIRKMIKDNGKTIVLDHFPLYEWEKYFKGSLHFHGHCHGNIGRSYKERAFDVGVDCWNFTPVTLEEILNA